MLQIFAVILASSATVAVLGVSVCDVDGYYWRDYTGDVPPDALLGGVDTEGYLTYIGQALYANPTLLITGQIKPRTRSVYYEFGNAVHEATQDFKILCTKHPERFQWVKAKVKDSISTVLKNNSSFVNGGREVDYFTTPGRIPVRNGVEIGKVVYIKDEFYGMFVGTAGKGGVNINDFEVLVYNPSIPKTDRGCGKTTNINFFN